jgi:ribonucleoside-diphosphate reductase alpha chain
MTADLTVENDITAMGPPQPLRDIDLSENSKVVLTKRYVRRQEDGKPAESIHEMFWRVASNVAISEEEHGDDSKYWADVFYNLLTDLRFMPNSPTFTGAGTPLGNLSACFVLPIEDDMGGSSAGIFQTLRDAALIQQTGGGNGFAFSRLRAKGALVRSSNGQASGPIGFLKAYDQAFGIINQGGARRGANMGVLLVSHPDIREFITCKTDETAVTNFNISVAITDEFMEAVRSDGTFDLVEPSTGRVRETVRARDLFDLITRQAHHNGEPGALFIDAANRSNPIPHIGNYEATNPCVTGDTRIFTDHGLVQARDLFDDETEIRVLTDSRFGLDHALTPSTRVFMTGTKPVFRLETVEGYSLRATADHRIMTPRGWVELGDLQPGDRIHIVNRGGAFGQEGSLELGRVLGWLIGDGTIKENAAVLSFFGDEKRELAPVFAEYVTELVEPLTSATAYRKSYPVGVIDVKGRDEARVYSERLRTLVAPYGLTEKKHQVPEAVFRGTEEMQRGFLQALFTADGSAQRTTSGATVVRLASSHESLLEEVQVLLMNFGIASRIYRNRRREQMRLLPDGKGGKKEYLTKAQHELAISKSSVVNFANNIGFLMEYKNQSLRKRLAMYPNGSPRLEGYHAKIKAITPDGIEDVFDITEPLTNSMITNGLVVHQCGEQFLLPYESCNLGSINLARLVTADGQVDWDNYQKTIEESVRFLDDVITANRYVDAVPQLKAAALASRRIGLGFMGLADMMIKVGLRYGSPEGQEFAGQISEFMRYHAMRVSIELAQERGPFLAIIGSIYDAGNFRWTPPQPVRPYTHDFGRPPLDWEGIVEGIKAHGIRNAAQTTIAPTGTIATVSGCEGYGCEPVFALAYTRYMVDGERKIELNYASPLLEWSLKRAGMTDDQIKRAVDQVSIEGTCQNVDEIPAHVRNALVVSGDITPEEHVWMQASIQAFIDNSISKTINMPSTATVDDVKRAYELAWELGCKGLTVYVTGSREVVVLETKATKEARQGEIKTEAAAPKVETSVEAPAIAEAPKAALNGSSVHPTAPTAASTLSAQNHTQTKKPRPGVLPGRTYRKATPVGTAYVTINENGDGSGQPFEVFITTSKAGSEIAAISDAIGRLISLILRQNSPISPRERTAEIVSQLEYIGGSRQMGFGPNRVTSLPDAIAQVLKDYLGMTEVDQDEEVTADEDPAAPATLLDGAAYVPLEVPPVTHRIGDICPSCGAATLIYREGCVSCGECGYSEC